MRFSSSCAQRADRHFSELRVREKMKDVVWCFKIPDFMWLKHFYLKDHDHSLLNMDMYAQFSMSVVDSSVEPVYQLGGSSAPLRGGNGRWHYGIWERCFSCYGIDVVEYVLSHLYLSLGIQHNMSCFAESAYFVIWMLEDISMLFP